ncbi:hypothetical protein V2A60_008209 [Cordyceps javanica]
MDTVYITSYTGRPSTSTENVVDAPAGGVEGAAPPRRRRWQLSVRLNSQQVRGLHVHYHHHDVALVDPFVDADYHAVFERYLCITDSPPPKSLSSTAAGNNEKAAAAAAAAAAAHLALPLRPQPPGGPALDSDDVARMERQIDGYAHSLLSQLRLREDLLRPEATDLQLYVVEQHHDAGVAAAAAADAPGIHCLAWELLESVRLPKLPNLRLRVSRVTDFAAAAPLGRSSSILRGGALLSPSSSPSPLETNTQQLSLAHVQADPSGTYRILLVVARDFSRTGAERDAEPDLAQYPLMSVQRKLRAGRMMLEVVRPGSVEELGEHLRVRSAQGVHFHIVHFDMHGQVMPDRSGVYMPWLLFAKRTYATQSNGYHLPQTRLAAAAEVADLLARHHVENVVLNACLSAYNRSSSATNLAHLLLQRGVRNVSAMWFYVHYQTAETYLEAFYHHLLRGGLDFHLAAQRGREAVRGSPTLRSGRPCKDDFLCVNYGWQAPLQQRTDGSVMTAREPSPAPSARSQSSSTSASSRGFGWKKSPSSPRLAESLIAAAGGGGSGGDEPVLRMTLHLLELEYKLVTFRVIYASDMHHGGRGDLADTIDRMAGMWLNTNMIDDVHYYDAKDFARDSLPPHRDRRSRASSSSSAASSLTGGGGYLQRFLSPLPQPVAALRATLHVIRNVDDVVDPGWRADDTANARNEERRVRAQEGLQRFARRLHTQGDSYCIFLGSRNVEWFERFLRHLHGAWWLHMPWGVTVPSRSPIPRRSRDRNGDGRDGGGLDGVSSNSNGQRA